MFSHICRYEAAILCSGQINYVSVIGKDEVAYIVLLTLIVIPKNSEDFRCSLDGDDGLGGVGSRM